MNLFSTVLGVLASGFLVECTQIQPQVFKSPPKSFGPKFRYWFPDASASVAAVVEDINAIGSIGGGGIEFLPLYNYGFWDPSFPSWNKFGFGSPAFRDTFIAALTAARKAGLEFDFSLGANQGQGVPVEPLTQGLAIHLVYGETTVTGGKFFEGKIPKANPFYNFDLSGVASFMHRHENWGPDKLVAVVAGGVKSVAPVHDSDLPEFEFLDTFLDESTLIDLTPDVVDGEISWNVPLNFTNYTLFAFYERFTNQRSVDAASHSNDIIGNGSWITDHFSAAGARLVIDFLEEHVLNNSANELLQGSGGHTWEDSMEMSSALWWSDGFLNRFEEARGYSLHKYLPLLFHPSNSFRAEYRPYNNTYLVTAMNSSQDKYLQDYRLTLNEGYQEYLGTLQDWARSLGLTHSAQVAYNLPLDMAASVPFVGTPELETLAFPDIDSSLQFVGAAHLSGQNIISSEIGAETSGAYSLSTTGLANLFKNSFVVGVNSGVVHGMAYGGEFLSTWPGYTPLSFSFGDMWGPRRPDWMYINETMAYVARNQLCLRTGTAKRDIAFYRYDVPWSMAVGYEPHDLRSAGYSYEYLGPANLASNQAVAFNNTLAPAGPGYKALVFNKQVYITPEAAVKVLLFAQQGLPIFVLGTLPNITVGAVGQGIVSDAMSTVAQHSNVELLRDSESLSERLAASGVRPRMSIVSGNNDLFSIWRSTDTADYVFLFNKGVGDVFKLRFAVSKDRVPYKLDAWTGEQSEVLVYNHDGDGLSISVFLSAEQTVVLAFEPSKATTRTHITSLSPNIERVERDPSGGVGVLLKDSSGTTLTLSNGTELTIGDSILRRSPLPSVLGPWNLTLESWVPGLNHSISQSAIETVHLGMQSDLMPWSNMTQVRNASGVGIYTTTFSVAYDYLHNPLQEAVIIHFGPVLNTLRAWVNGRLLPPLDPANAETEISGFLSPGINTIRAEVSSNLFNAVKARADWVRTLGQPVLFPGLYENAEFQPFGLIGPVTLRQLRRAVVELDV